MNREELIKIIGSHCYIEKGIGVSIETAKLSDEILKLIEQCKKEEVIKFMTYWFVSNKEVDKLTNEKIYNRFKEATK